MMIKDIDSVDAIRFFKNLLLILYFFLLLSICRVSHSSKMESYFISALSVISSTKSFFLTFYVKNNQCKDKIIYMNKIVLKKKV
jgi:hypothetical protein